MNVAAGLDDGISFLDHIRSWKGYVPLALALALAGLSSSSKGRPLLTYDPPSS